jgi:hypothetical protein
MKEITKEELKSLIANTNGKWFSCRFRKVNGEDRKMTCRTGVTKHLKGVGAKYHKDNLKVVFDAAKLEYRNVNLDTTYEIKFKGEVYHVKS